MNACLEQKELALDAVALNNADLMTLAREVAKLIACERGWVDIDQFRNHPSLKDRQPSSPGFWGAVIRGKGWVMVNEGPSTKTSNHGRRIIRWQWRP